MSNYNNQDSFNLPGTFSPHTPGQRTHIHSISNRSLEFSPQGKAQARNRMIQENTQFSSPRDQQLRANNAIRGESASPNTPYLTSRSKSHTNFLKLIPPMPDHPETQGPQTIQRTNPQFQAEKKPLHFHNTLHHPRSNHNNRPNTNFNPEPNPNPDFNHMQPPSSSQPQNLGYSTPPAGSTKNTNISTVAKGSYTPASSAVSNVPSSCAKCGKQISTKSVKALGKRYHTQCFGCADCGTPILSKYFPFETADGQKLPLCEEHFYERRGLICCVCDSFLKGTHYTVFGRKYDAEHFCCKICSKKFETDEDFFNHDNNIYCHYHFSKFFIERCEGCEFAILKQYVEIFRGGKNQKWHVECYMIHKCWNVAISPSSIGITSFPKFEPTEENIKTLQDVNPTPQELLIMESKASEKISEIWNTLFKFEEDTATCISNMLQFTTTKDQQKGLEATARLVFKIDALFKSLDSLHRLGIDPNFTGISSFDTSNTDNKNIVYTLKKEPRNLSAKIMVYLAMLRKISKGATDSSSSQDLILSVVTGLAHYLKSLIRYGLNNSLQYNKNSHTTNALDKFLREIRNHEALSKKDVFSSLDLPVDASDLCFHCRKSIESECAQYKDKRWHVGCIICSKCHKNLQESGGISDASFNSETNSVLCSHCALDDPDAKPGFKSVSKLLQLSYLLKIAISRSKAVMEYEVQNGINKQVNANGEVAEAEAALYEQNYLKTLSDIKRLRSTRQNTRVTVPTSSKENARRSVIIESIDTADNQAQLNRGRESGNNPQNSEEELISKQKITVEDEPLGPTQLSKNSFNRATSFINNQKVLTLDDIPRIVAAEHARELRPNTYKFHNPYQQGETLSKEVKSKSNSIQRNASNSAKPSAINRNTMTSMNEKTVTSKYYSELSDHERFVIKHISAILIKRLLAKYSVGQDIDITKLFDLKKSPTFWGKLKGIGNNEKKIVSISKVFGSDLNDLTKKTGVDSSQTNGPSKVKIPMLIDDLLTALYQKDMSVEGVFRKNGNLKTLRELTELIDSNPAKIPPLGKENVVQLSALLKKFLREMPNPLLTFNLYDLWIISQKKKDKIPTKLFTELNYSLLPKAHRDLSEVLLFFIMWASSFSHIDEQSGSKMDIHNLATVLSPNILYDMPSEVCRPSQNKGVAATSYYDAFGENEGENYYIAIEVVDYLITHSEKLSIVPRYLLDIYQFGKFSGLVQATSKELFAKVENIFESYPDILERVTADNAESYFNVEESSIFEVSDTAEQAVKTSYVDDN